VGGRDRLLAGARHGQEPLAVAHAREDVALDIGENLADVVPVVVDLFVEQVLHGQEADGRMLAAEGEVGRL
jgi:hypothetical protein